MLSKKQREAVESWCDALESGVYEQGQYNLRKQNGDAVKYCCLGVACDLVDPTGWTAYIPSASVGVWTRQVFGKYNIQFPPQRVNDVYGIDTNFVEQLANMNDMQKKNFKEIAAWIRNWLLKEIDNEL